MIVSVLKRALMMSTDVYKRQYLRIPKETPEPEPEEGREDER